MVWDANYEAPSVEVCGRREEFEAGDPFVDVVVGMAREAGFSKFRVFVTKNGYTSEVDESDAPNVLEEGMSVSVKPYEKAA